MPMHRRSRLDPRLLYRKPVRVETDAFERVGVSFGYEHTCGNPSVWSAFDHSLAQARTDQKYILCKCQRK